MWLSIFEGRATEKITIESSSSLFFIIFFITKTKVFLLFLRIFFDIIQTLRKGVLKTLLTKNNLNNLGDKGATTLANILAKSFPIVDIIVVNFHFSPQ